MYNIFSGVLTALITPFKNGQIDYSAMKNLIDIQIGVSGINGLVIAGSTGEGGMLTDDEYYALMQNVVEFAKNEISIIASVATIGTQMAIEKVQKLQKIGVTGLMCTVPHYSKPTQEGVIQHYNAIHENSRLPIMVYIHPGRTGIDLTDDTILELSKCSRIIAIKDASCDIERPLRLRGEIHENFNLLSGDDSMAVAYYAHGGNGVVSVASNIIPDICTVIHNHCIRGEYRAARLSQHKLMPFYAALNNEPNPIGIKYAISDLGLCQNELRLPLTKATKATESVINNVNYIYKQCHQ